MKIMCLKNQAFRHYSILGISLLVSTFCLPLWAASERDELRIDIGISIFPKVLAVDTEFRHKLTANNQVKLAFVYSNDRKKAENLANIMLEKRSTIAGAKVVTEAISINQLLKLKPNNYAAIFITEKLSDSDISVLVGISVAQSRILFSPYIGDVERGVAIGIMITSRVWPYLNMHSIEESGVSLNTLLIKYSKRYE